MDVVPQVTESASARPVPRSTSPSGGRPSTSAEHMGQNLSNDQISQTPDPRLLLELPPELTDNVLSHIPHHSGEGEPVRANRSATAAFLRSTNRALRNSEPATADALTGNLYSAAMGTLAERALTLRAALRTAARLSPPFRYRVLGDIAFRLGDLEEPARFPAAAAAIAAEAARMRPGVRAMYVASETERARIAAGLAGSLRISLMNYSRQTTAAMSEQDSRDEMATVLSLSETVAPAGRAAALTNLARSVSQMPPESWPGALGTLLRASDVVPNAIRGDVLRAILTDRYSMEPKQLSALHHDGLARLQGLSDESQLDNLRLMFENYDQTHFGAEPHRLASEILGDLSQFPRSVQRMILPHIGSVDPQLRPRVLELMRTQFSPTERGPFLENASALLASGSREARVGLYDELTSNLMHIPDHERGRALVALGDSLEELPAEARPERYENLVSLLASVPAQDLWMPFRELTDQSGQLGPDQGDEPHAFDALVLAVRDTIDRAFPLLVEQARRLQSTPSTSTGVPDRVEGLNALMRFTDNYIPMPAQREAESLLAAEAMRLPSEELEQLDWTPGDYEA